jgi:Cys-tRNA(Pro) deacylase
VGGNLTGFLVASKVEFEFLEKKVTHHVHEASLASGISTSELVKTIVFLNQDSRPLIAVVLGDQNVSRHKLQELSKSKDVRVAPDEIAESMTGYPTGGIPPVGHRRRIPVYIDNRVMARQHVWAGGGCRTKLVKLKTADIARLSNATIEDIVI